MKNRVFLLIAPIITLILEILPYGAVLKFAFQNPDGSIGTKRDLYSYFDPFPIGYARIAPFLTAILTCITLLLLIIFCITNNRHIMVSAKIVLCMCTAFSLSPLFFGGASIVGVLVSLSIIVESILLFVIKT